MTEKSTDLRQDLPGLASPDWRVWLSWVLATTFGWTAGGAFGVAVGSGAGILVAGAAGLAVGGLAAGLLQWRALRRQITGVGWWAPAYPAAAAGASLFGLAAGSLLSRDAGWVLGSGAYGILVSVLHWLVLRRQVERAGWWLLANAAGWIVGGPVAGILDAAVNADLGWAALGIAYGAITGIVLMWLLRQPAAVSGEI